MRHERSVSNVPRFSKIMDETNVLHPFTISRKSMFFSSISSILGRLK